MNVSAIEFLWVMLNTVTLVFTITALFDARADREAVRILNGKARELAASGIVRREFMRVIVQILLLTIAVPGLFSDRVTTLNPITAVLMAVPVLLLLTSFWDARERKHMTILVTAAALAQKTDDMAELKGMLAHNTKVSQGARDDAHEAAEVANNVNVKIANLETALVQQGDDRAAAAALKATVDTTAEQVSDLHEGTAPS